MRIDTKTGQTAEPCSFDQFLGALDNPAPVLADRSRTARSGEAILPFAARDDVSVMPRGHSAMMAPVESPFWIGVVRSMRARQDRIGVACLLVAITLFIMIAGRLAWAYAAGAL